MRETFKDLEELKAELKNWEKLELCIMGSSFYVILSRHYIQGIHKVQRWKVKESLYKQAQKLLKGAS